MDKSSPAGARSRWIVTTIWLAVFVVLVPLGFGRAGDVVVDSFHDLTTAMRISSGEALYKEIAYLYGPVGAYVVWIWTSIFGLSVKAYLGLCAHLAAIELYLVDRLSRRYLAPLGRLFLLLGVTGVFTLHSELFSRLMPYSISAFLAELGFLFFLERWAAGRDVESGPVPGAAAGLAAGLLMHTKLEFGLVAAVAIGLDLFSGVVPDLSGNRQKDRRKALVSGWLLGLLLGFPLVYSLGGDIQSYLSNIDPRPFLSSGAGRKLAEIAGGATTADRAMNVFRFAGLSGLALLLPASVIWFFSVRTLRTGVVAALSVLLGVFFRSEITAWLDYTPLTAVILLLVLAAAAILPGLKRNRTHSTKLLLAVAAGGLLLRSPGALAPGLFGTFYLLPALVVGLMLSGQWIRWLGVRLPRRSAQALVFGFFLYSLPGLEANLSRFRVKEYAPSVRLLPFTTDGTRARVIGKTLTYLSDKVRPGDYLAVMPQEPVIYFALQAKPVFPDHNFIAHIVRGDPVPDLVDRLESRRPKFVVVSNRPYREGGLGAFGTDYGQELQAVIGRDYRVAQRFGQPAVPAGAVVTGTLGDPYYAITVYERKD